MPPKRPREVPKGPTPTSRLSEQDQAVLNAVKSKADLGMSMAELKAVTKLPPNIVTKSINSLKLKGAIKEVRSVQRAGAKMFMACEFEPSKEISGGSWYVDGAINTSVIKALETCCMHCIKQSKVATADMIVNFVKDNKVLVDMDFSTQQALEILGPLVLDRAIEQCISTGIGDFASVKKGRTCFRLGSGSKPEDSALASIPCGVCPRTRDCTPDGIISPKTCVYYNKWIESMDF